MTMSVGKQLISVKISQIERLDCEICDLFTHIEV